VESNIATYIGDPTAINLAYMVIVIFSLLWVIVGATAVTIYYRIKKPQVIANAGMYDAEVAE
jgi:purine-cytosine permease-like protein